MVFLNRIGELELLNRWWTGDQPELVTVYGRRQVGKTELLVQFLQDKPSIYFYADRQLVADHLRAFTEQVLSLVDDPLLRIQPFATWEAALTYTLRLAETRRIALVIDEFSYAAHDIGSLGVWWQASEELEIVGETNGSVVLAAEAKWTNDPVGHDILRALRRRVAVLPLVADDCQLAIFSKSGFRPEVLAEASPLLLLINLDRMYA